MKGFKVVVADRSESLIELARAPFDLIFTDLFVPSTVDAT
jgi:hypothetical protein